MRRNLWDSYNQAYKAYILLRYMVDPSSSTYNSGYRIGFGNSLIQLAAANHEDCHFEFCVWRRDMH